jgi:hypothetical protein
MDSPVENIVQHLFHTGSLENVAVSQLQQLVAYYTYFDAGYFLLAKKLNRSKEPGYEKAIQQAALHFSNDLWLHFQLNNEISKPGDFIADNPEPISEPETAAATTQITETIPAENFEPVVETATDENNGIDDTEIESIDENYNEADFPVNEKLSNILKEQAAALEKPVEENADLPLENIPYHRVDYFDSQGIKLDEDKANDKLGTQLRRFTDWLKQMKKSGPSPASLSNDVEGEMKVQHMAEDSNAQQETITETMAEVLAKQGKPEQAIEIYQKLSFINPSKTAYFAAKIEELKG